MINYIFGGIIFLLCLAATPYLLFVYCRIVAEVFIPKYFEEKRKYLEFFNVLNNTNDVDDDIDFMTK